MPSIIYDFEEIAARLQDSRWYPTPESKPVPPVEPTHGRNPVPSKPKPQKYRYTDV